jgi:hypothetical protein
MNSQSSTIVYAMIAKIQFYWKIWGVVLEERGVKLVFCRSHWAVEKMIGQVMTASRAVRVNERPVQSRTAALYNTRQRLAKILDHSDHPSRGAYFRPAYSSVCGRVLQYAC